MGLLTSHFLFWWLLPDLNWGHKALQASALPTELKSHIGTYIIQQVMHVSDTSAPLLYYFYSCPFGVNELKSHIGNTDYTVNHANLGCNGASALRFSFALLRSRRAKEPYWYLYYTTGNARLGYIGASALLFLFALLQSRRAKEPYWLPLLFY